jgi:hypothetical protein
MITPLYLLMIIAMTLFLFGMGLFISGAIILILRVNGKQVKALATQTVTLAQKGVTDDIPGLVGNATSLLEALNQLLRTTAGIGGFLTILGLILIAAACWLAIQIYPVWI